MIIGGGEICGGESEGGAENAHGQTHLDATANTTLSVSDQYYVLNGDFISSSLNLFTVLPNGALTFIGTDTSVVIFDFSASFITSGPGIITFGLFLNDVLIPGSEFDEEFPTMRFGEPSFVFLASISNGNKLQVKAKSNVADMVLILNRFGLVLWSN